MNNGLDQPALIVGTKSKELIRINEGFSKNNTELSLNYKKNSKNDTVVNAQFRFSGFMEQNMRNWWTHNQDRDSKLDKFVKAIFTNTTTYTVKAHLNNADNLWKPVNISAEFIFPEDKTEESTTALFATSFLQLFNNFGQLNELQAPQTRKHRFVDHYPYDLTLKASMIGDNTVIPTVVKSSGDIQTPYATLTQVGRSDNNSYFIDAHFTKPKLNLTVKQFAQYHKTLE